MTPPPKLLPPQEHSHSGAAMTPSRQALLGPHQSLVGDSCGQKNKQKNSSRTYLFLQQPWPCTSQEPGPGESGWEFPDEGQDKGQIRPIATRVSNCLIPRPHPPCKASLFRDYGAGHPGRRPRPLKWPGLLLSSWSWFRPRRPCPG